MGKCVEEFVVGEVSSSPGRTVTETDIVQYSWVSGDTNPMHTDAEYSARSPLGRRIAHGTLGMSICTGLSARMGQFDGTAIAALGVDEWRFLAPIFIGDTVYLRTTVLSARISASKPDRGVVTRQMELLNQHGDVTQRGLMRTMVYSKEGLAAVTSDEQHNSATAFATEG
ncbi:dehydratase [Rhodococcus rhodnii]|uniref:MaoC protein n=2 Tax=Rhodococcus rhodnii TaxID=38312 RepID=R7WNP6_9NOCA|nr:MaoC/PaaZ C-terminal domain-containing protein [Rhodococcus rhodnii]EOM76936.1 MaoC protein [Rhodococcus rhodnii LMG 5362]TXG89821.1 dehydratase [Rhodococcus rhodnii]